MNDDLRDQYEHYPYPPRDPADEAHRLVSGSPSHIAEIEHHILGGRRDASKPFRILVAKSSISISRPHRRKSQKRGSTRAA